MSRSRWIRGAPEVEAHPPGRERTSAELNSKPDRFRFCDDCASATGDEGTFLQVGSSDQPKAEYSLYELLGRGGIVSRNRNYVQAAKEEIESIVDTIESYTTLYELEAIDPDEHIRTATHG